MTKTRLISRLASLVLLLLGASCQSAVPAEPEGWEALTIYEASWTDTNGMEAQGRFADREDGPYLIANVVEWDGWPKMKEFTARASKDWLLVGDDGTHLSAGSGTGGTSTSDGKLRAIILRPKGSLPPAGSGVTYRLVPENQVDGARWKVLPQVRIVR